MGNADINISVQAGKAYCYALFACAYPLMSEVRLRNASQQGLRDLELRIVAEAGSFEPWSRTIAGLAAGASMELCPNLQMKREFLGNVKDSFEERVSVELLQARGEDAGEGEAELLASALIKIEILPAEQWPAAVPEALACFSIPAQPEIGGLLDAAAETLERWGAKPSFDGYDSDDPERARSMAAAAFESVRALELSPLELPAGYAAKGTRLNFGQDLSLTRRGNALDVGLIYSSCLQAMGLNPLLCLCKERVFAGLWLEEKSFPESVIDDLEELRVRVLDRSQQILLFDCAALFAGSALSLDEAVQSAREQLFGASELVTSPLGSSAFASGALVSAGSGLAGSGLAGSGSAAGDVVAGSGPGFLFCVDIKRAQRAGMRPLPLGRMRSEQAPELGRIEVWERSLLDLSLRNNLLNMRIGPRVLPLAVANLDDLEEALGQGTSLQLAPCPLDWTDIKQGFGFSELIGPYESFLRSEFKSRRLRSILPESDMTKALTSLFRSAKSSLDETGSNILFISLGALRWFKDGDKTPRYAPLLMLPVELSRKSARSPFTLLIRDEDMQINVSLLEMLRRDFGIEVPGMNPLPQAEAGVDLRLILNSFAHSIQQQSNWEVLEISCLGLFSFSSFVMWEDIHSHEAELRRSKIVSSLMDGQLSWDAQPMVLPDKVEQGDALLAVQTDASQLFAIREAVSGKSFVLHGPPGAGKSQVITGIIANALAHEQRVLFVSEKSAALNVVQQRLEQLGIGEFCLELHSNKATKSHVLDQLQQASELAAEGDSSDYESKLSELQRLRKQLDGYAANLSKRNAAGLSLREQICCYQRYRNAPGPDLPVDKNFVTGINSPAQLEELLREVNRICSVAGQLGDISKHPLRFFAGKDYSHEWKFVLPEILEKLKLSVDELEDACDQLACYAEDSAQNVDPDYYVIGPAAATQVKDKNAAAGAGGKASGKASGKAASGKGTASKNAPAPTALLALETLKTEPSSKEEWEAYAELCKLLESCPDLPALWLAQKKPTSLLDALSAALKARGEMLTLEEKAEGRWIPDFFELEPDEVEKEWTEANKAGLFKRKKAIAAALAHVGGYSLKPLGEADVPAAVALLRKYRGHKDKLQKRLEFLDPYLEGAYHAYGEYDWDAMEASLKIGRSFYAKKKAPALNTSLFIAIREDEHLEGLIGIFNEKWKAMKGLLDELEAQMGPLQMPESEDCLPFLRSSVDALLNSRKLQEWMRWQALADDMRGKGLACVPDALAAGAQADQMPAAFKRALYKAMCYSSFAGSKQMASFNGAAFEESLARYAECDRKLLELSRKQLRLQVAGRLPDLTLMARSGTEAAVFKRALRSRGRGTSIRQLFGQIPELLSKLAPCMLMSPLSVAQYLDIESEPFDLLIFDEASQLQTCKALGSLARAKNAIIVGDPKQMPPTSFFQSQNKGDEFSDVCDLESILDDCLAINMPESYLQLHYRSQHESLIAFSNRQFYQSRLSTFPSVDDTRSRVRLVHVPGCYEGNGRNSAEARAIVAELRKRYKDAVSAAVAAGDTKPAAASIGVICFNVKQQELIEDLLELEYSREPGFERWTQSGPEPMFVKNLENVQGDERDSILFSITYAPDANGRMAMRFGPLNNEGGWRRLNVAVTRSRRDMTVFATLKPEQMDLSRSGSKGVHSLKAFLDFAQEGRFTVGEGDESGSEDFIAKQIGDVLLKLGYRVSRNVGSSAFKVDIAIQLPEDDTSISEDKDDYLLGVLLDGEMYSSAHCTRDREILRPQVLEGLGWKLHRIWAIDWLADGKKVMKQLLAHIDKAKQERIAAAQSRQDAATRAAAQAAAASDVNDRGSRKDALAAYRVEGLGSSFSSPAVLGDASAAAISSAAAASIKNSVLDMKGSVALSVLAGVSVPQTMNRPRAKFVPYSYFQLPEGPVLTSEQYQSGLTEEIRSRFEGLIRTEAPIELSSLCNRVRESFGILRSGKHVQARSEEVLEMLPHVKRQRGEDVFVWRVDQRPEDYLICRLPSEEAGCLPCNELCDEELIALFLLVIQEQGPMIRDELLRAAAARYGYKRVASRMYNLLGASIEEGLRRGLLIEEHGLVRAL